MHLFYILSNFIEKYIKSQKAQKSSKSDEPTPPAPMILPKKIDFNIKSFKITIIMENDQRNFIRLQEKAFISRAFELNIDFLHFSLNFKREIEENEINIKIACNFKLKNFLFQVEEIGEYFIFCNLQTLEFNTQYQLNEIKTENKIIINSKNTLKVIFLIFF